MMQQAAPATEPYVPAIWRVAMRRQETPDTVTFALAPSNANAVPDFAPGQFNMLYAFGIGEVPISISGHAGDGQGGAAGGVSHTLRAAGTVTRGLVGLAEGDALGLRGPFGNEWPLAAAEGGDLLLIGGGLGLAPLRPAINAALARRAAYRNVVIVYGTRSPDYLLFAPDLRAWRDRIDAECAVTVDRAGPDWRGHVGTVVQRLQRASFDPACATAMICGPEIMMRKTAEALTGMGLAPERVYISMERNMKCALGRCGHCQFGQHFLCQEGPVFPYARVAPLLNVAEV
jgi:NAD(P)H-flavin reductase